MQFQADILGVPVVRHQVIETTALGAAYLSGLAAGYWKDRAEIAAKWKVDKEFSPNIDEKIKERLYKGWEKAVNRSLNWEKKE